MPQPLTIDQVRHVAKLARLRLGDDQLRLYAEQLSTVLDHIATLSRVDVNDVEPMAYPIVLTNRLGDDEVSPSMTLEQVLANAPATEGDYLAVPKVLGEGGGA